jgi:hypothetical protein
MWMRILDEVHMYVHLMKRYSIASDLAVSARWEEAAEIRVSYGG